MGSPWLITRLAAYKLTVCKEFWPELERCGQIITLQIFHDVE